MQQGHGGLSAPLLVWLCIGAAWRWGWVCTHVCASIHPSPLEAPASSQDNHFEADVTAGSQQAPYLLSTTGAPVVCRIVGTPTPGAKPAWGWQRGEGTGVLRVGSDLSPSFCRDQEEPKEPRSDFAPLILPR